MTSEYQYRRQIKSLIIQYLGTEDYELDEQTQAEILREYARDLETGEWEDWQLHDGDPDRFPDSVENADDVVPDSVE